MCSQNVRKKKLLSELLGKRLSIIPPQGMQRQAMSKLVCQPIAEVIKSTTEVKQDKRCF